MKLLLIGGTSFVGRAAVEDAVDRGHEVTVFHRGEREPDELAGIEHVHGDRDGGLDALRGRAWDAVLDTCGFVPRVVRDSARSLADAVGTYGFVSSLSVLPDDAMAGANDETPVHRPPFPRTEEITNESYGPLKVACELEVRAAFTGRCLVIRPGYIVGPYDPTDRFTYWVRRASNGGEMAAPEPKDGALQVVDVRDLASFMLDHLEAGTDGTFGVVGPREPLTWSAFLDTVLRTTGGDTTVTWLPGDLLRSELGEALETSLPLWDVAYPGLHSYDASRAFAAGLRHRPLADTIEDLLAWDRARGQTWPMKAGLTPELESRLLRTWQEVNG